MQRDGSDGSDGSEEIAVMKMKRREWRMQSDEMTDLLRERDRERSKSGRDRELGKKGRWNEEWKRKIGKEKRAEERDKKRKKNGSRGLG